MRAVKFICTTGIVGILAGCGTSSVDADKPEETDDSTPVEETDAPVVESDEDTAAPEDTAPPYVVTFTEGRFKVDTLTILGVGEGLDLYNGPQIDNKLATLLALVQSQIPDLPGDFGVDDINDNIAELLEDERAIVLMEARHLGGNMTIDVVQGERDAQSLEIYALPEFYDNRGIAVQRLRGQFTDADAFLTGPDLITIPIQFYANEPSLQITAEEASVDGTVSAGFLEGTIGGALPVSLIMDDVVAPLINNFYGEGETADGFIGLAQLLIQGNADVTLPGGTKAVSGAFSFSARANAWKDPRVVPAP